MSKKNPSRPARRLRRAGDGDATSTDLARIMETLHDTGTEVRCLLGDDPALGHATLGGNEPMSTPAGNMSACPVPVVLFEPRGAVAREIKGSSGPPQEMQAEAIIQAGFSRWRTVTAFEHLYDWSVRQTPDGLELWDHGGLWAKGPVTVPGAWWDAANEWGVVLAVYGVKVGVSNFGAEGQDDAARREIMREGRRAGITAAGLVTWRGLPMPAPEEMRFPGPSYDPATGKFEIAKGPGGAVSYWNLHTPGEGVRSGLIVAAGGMGKTSLLSIVQVEAIASGRFAVLAADPEDRHDLSWGDGILRVAKGPEETLKMLQAAARAARGRLAEGGYADPSPSAPGILVTVDECQAAFAGNPEATRLAEEIACTGGPAGVGLVVTARGPETAYFGGSSRLRAALAAGNCVASTPAMIKELTKAREAAGQRPG